MVPITLKILVNQINPFLPSKNWFFAINGHLFNFRPREWNFRRVATRTMPLRLECYIMIKIAYLYGINKETGFDISGHFSTFDVGPRPL